MLSKLKKEGENEKMDEKPKEHSSSFRVRIHQWWTNLKRTHRDNLKKDKNYQKGKNDIKSSKSGIEAQVENMRPRRK